MSTVLHESPSYLWRTFVNFLEACGVRSSHAKPCALRCATCPPPSLSLIPGWGVGELVAWEAHCEHMCTVSGGSCGVYRRQGTPHDTGAEQAECWQERSSPFWGPEAPPLCRGDYVSNPLGGVTSR